MPEDFPAPEGEVFPVFGSIADDLRDKTNFKVEDRDPQACWDRSAVLCFSEDGALFSSVAASPATAPGPRALCFQSDQGLADAFWQPATDLKHCAMKEDIVLLRNRAKNGVRLPKFLPLPAPVPLTPGVVGDATVGSEGFQAVVKHCWQAAPDSLLAAWSGHPVVTEWLEAVRADPDCFTTDWADLAWVKESIARTPGACVPPMANELVHHHFRQAMCTISWRLHLDFIEATASVTLRQNVERCLDRAFTGLLTLDGGWTPGKAMGELPALRPPASLNNWNKHFNFSAFTKLEFLAPGDRTHTVTPVPTSSKVISWPQEPLKRQRDGASEPTARD
jgi:hypothetical protein